MYTIIMLWLDIPFSAIIARMFTCSTTRASVSYGQPQANESRVHTHAHTYTQTHKRSLSTPQDRDPVCLTFNINDCVMCTGLDTIMETNTCSLLYMS